MTSFFDRLFGRKPSGSAAAARERLKLVLVTDRSNLSPERLEQMQGEILDVIRDYLQVDDEAVEIKMEHRERKNYLVADIPIVRENLLPDLGALPGALAEKGVHIEIAEDDAASGAESKKSGDA